MKQYKIQKHTLKNKITQNLPNAETTTPSHVRRGLRSPFRAPSTATWGLRLGELRRRPSNTSSNNSKGKHGTKEECTKSIVVAQYFNFNN